MREYSVLMTLGLLSMLLIGLQLSASPTMSIEAEQVKFEPKLFNLTDPEPVIAHIKFPEPHERNTTDIDPSTVLLEGSLQPMSNWTTRAPPEFVAEFDGTGVVNILWGKITHMGALAPPYKIWITVTGYLKDTEGGTPFSCTGYIKIIVHHSPPPP